MGGVFSCFFPITGGRIGEIVYQETGILKCSELPVTKDHCKFEKFCENYKHFIDVPACHERFAGFWKSEKKLSADNPKKAKSLLLRTLWKSFWIDLLKAFFSKLTWSVLVIFSIWFFVFQILDFIKARAAGEVTTSENYEFYLVGGFAASMYVLSIGIQQMGMYSSILGAKVKGALNTAIYKKMIIRDAYGSHHDVVALVAKDVEKIAEACLTFQFLWSGIAETIGVLIVVSVLMGKALLPGLALMAIFLPLNYWLGMVVAYRKKHLAEVSEERISLMEEILRGIKLIKIYGWESSFFDKLTAIRQEELRLEGRINNVKSWIMGLIFSLPPLLSMCIFGTQEALGTIEPVMVFTVLSFFNTLRVPFSKLPKSLRDVLDAFNCLERIQDFLLEPDLVVAKDQETRDIDHVPNHQGVVLRNVSVSYGPEGKIVLNNVNLDIPHGKLVMVAGPVASGKSNLLKTILGDVTVRGGSITVSSHKAYVPQVPWTALGTVRDNIVFGKPYDEAFYRKVVHACALEPDLKIMPDGDMTWIGERGGNLSGGQKQRIALARAAYSRAELYVLDSPLSAVDMYTCQHIFEHCIKDLMIAGGGTVVLATHQTELFSKSDHLIVMKDGEAVYNAKYNFNGIKPFFPNFQGDVPEDDKVDTKQMVVKDTKKSKAETRGSEANALPSWPKKEYKPVHVEKEGSIYSWYIKQIGVWLFTGCTVFFCTAQVVRVYGDVWVSKWTKREYEPEFTSDKFYAGIYLLLVVSFFTMSLLRAHFYYGAGKVGATTIHEKCFKATLHAPMHYFHVTPVGKLLNFFSYDMDVIDDMLVDNVLLFQILFFILIQAIGVVCYNLITFLAISGGLAFCYCWIVYVYIKTSEPLKHASSESMNQVVAHTAETLSGLAVVRAFRQQDRFVVDNLDYQSRSTVVNFSLANLSLWLQYRCDLIGIMLVIGCCLLALLDTTIDAPVAGLIVSNSFQILLFFSVMTRTLGEVHDNMKAADEACKVSKLEAEIEPTKIVQTPANWPKRGEISFEGVVMPYLPGKPPVLRGINFSIREGEKIGVVGRTGAGKSSLIVALYRLAELDEGLIKVDGVDCADLQLNTLRRSMAIIPQEPVMFSGTLRTNLDPFNEHDDSKLLDVLHKCLLKEVVESDPNGLDAKVEQLGSNFSLGTQQLICLARAMLNPSRILLLDEATAALDSDTNAAVSQILKAHFSERTIFTIAHRLDTVIESDRILVMNAGVVAEYERPDVLLNDPESIFSELCMRSGRAQYEVLVEKARAFAAAKGLA